MPIITVIIPVYNTEKYLRRCVDSVLAQTMADFELILVDDGSTDSSGSVCDEYAAKDERIVVFHQENKGQAAARNVALDYVFAKGGSEWIAFIDSDDWVDQRYFELLLNAALKIRTSVSICEYVSVNSEDETHQPSAIDAEIRSAESLYCERNTISITPWGKLYAKELWNNIRYPEGKIHEDEFVTYKILFDVKDIAYISTPLYYYVINPSGTTRSEWTPARLAAFEAKAEQIQFMQEHSYKEAFRHAVWNYAGNICKQLSQIDQDKYPDEAVKLRKALRKHIIKYKKYRLFSLREKKEIHRVAYPMEMRVIDKIIAVKRWIYGAYIQLRYKPKIMDSERTVNYIIKKQCSVSRFGDGEYEMMMGISNIGFQQSCRKLSNALSNVLRNSPDHLLLCIWDIFGMMTEYNKKSKRFWKKWNKKNKTGFTILLHKCCGSKYLFGNARFTRPYIGHPNDKNAKKLFPLIKKLWDNRDVLIVEGEQTRFGVGNDLLDNAGSVVRILAPAVNAFSKYDEILSAIRQEADGRLILLALGPTATVLACELCRLGFWAIDIGHLDIEYEWYRMGAKEKVAVPGKYTNEAGGVDVAECHDAVYKKQIIRRIP